MKHNFILIIAISISTIFLLGCEKTNENKIGKKIEGFWANTGECIKGKEKYNYDNVYNFIEFKDDICKSIDYTSINWKYANYSNGYMYNCTPDEFKVWAECKYIIDKDNNLWLAGENMGTLKIENDNKIIIIPIGEHFDEGYVDYYYIYERVLGFK